MTDADAVAPGAGGLPGADDVEAGALEAGVAEGVTRAGVDGVDDEYGESVSGQTRLSRVYQPSPVRSGWSDADQKALRPS